MLHFCLGRKPGILPEDFSFAFIQRFTPSSTLSFPLLFSPRLSLPAGLSRAVRAGRAARCPHDAGRLSSRSRWEPRQAAACGHSGKATAAPGEAALPAPAARAPRPQQGGRHRPPRPSGGRRRGRHAARPGHRERAGEAGRLPARLAAAAPGARRQPAPGAPLTSMETRQPCMALKPKWSGRGPSPAPSPELFTVLGCDR